MKPGVGRSSFSTARINLSGSLNIGMRKSHISTEQLAQLLKIIIKETVLDEVGIGEFQEVCFSAKASSHSLRTCKLKDKKFYLKFSGWEAGLPQNPNENLQIGVEYLAYQIYKLYGIKVPTDIHLVSDPENKKIGLATEETTKVGRFNTQKIGQSLSSGVFVDVFLANWDMSNTENLIPSGEDVTRIDPGGALTFRARGAKKGKAFNTDATELKTMLDPYGDAGKIYSYSDMAKAAATFMKVDWSSVASTITNAGKEVYQEMIDAGVTPETQAAWDKEVKEILHIMKGRHKVVLEHINFTSSK
jgi:hypothetical protein